MSYKNRNLVRISISKQAKEFLPENRQERNEFIEKAVEKYLRRPLKNTTKFNKYELETVSFDDTTGIMKSLTECNPKIPPANMLNDAILRA